MVFVDEAPPGLKLTYQVDLNSDNVTDSEFTEYLNHNHLHVDVWDGDSLLYLGSSLVNLRSSLRQGKSGVAFEDDLDIVFEEV